MAFEGYAALAFIAPDGTEDGRLYKPGEKVELPDDTEKQLADINRLLNMGVLQRTDPAGNTEVWEDTALPVANAPQGEVVEGKPRTRSQAKLAEKAKRDGAQ
jgi:hypothetical protein